MKFHKKFRLFLQLLEKKFDVEYIECIYSNFKLILTLYYSTNYMNVKELSNLLGITEDAVLFKIRDLNKYQLLKIVKTKKERHLRIRNHYQNNLDEQFILKFNECITCLTCGNLFGNYGGLIHENVCSDEPIKVFCNKKCRDEYFA